jgi:two-component system, cell cycle sensor histidine kinase and response regulator CckA
MPSIKVIFLSGYMEDEMILHGVATGATSFLQKPFTGEVFLQKVHGVLHDSSQG